MNVREIACSSLITICRDKGYSNIVVSQAIQKYNLQDRDRRFYTELVYGSIRSLNYLDWILSFLSTRKLHTLDPICLAILRLGIYQIFGMTKVPESAACNESVKLALRFGNKGMSKFVNGVLRNSIRRRNEFQIPSLEDKPELHIALTYHQPTWLIRKWLAEFGTDETIKLCQYFETIPSLCIRTNTTRITREALMERLQDKGMDAQPAEYAPEGIYLKNIPAIHEINEIQEGLAFIQDEPSMLVAHILEPGEKETILDVCAAPGGKTTHLAALAGPTSAIYACDIYEHKLKLIEDNAKRLGLKNIHTLMQDGTTVGDKYVQKFDRVLVDAPCSGLGVLKRKLDLRWRKDPRDLKTLPTLQYKILESAAKCVKPNGVLVYSTCTMNDAENNYVVDTFLKNHSEFHLENAASYSTLNKEGPYIQLLPQIDGLDGFFIARLKRGDK